MGKAVFFCAVSLHKKTPLSPLYWEETNYISQSLRNKAILKLIGTIIKTAIVLAICSRILVVAYKGNQPMQVPQAPKGIAYFEFIADWMNAAKTIQPSRCAWEWCYPWQCWDRFILLFIPKLEFIHTDFWHEGLPRIQTFLRMRPARNGMKCQGSGGIRLNDFHGRW